VLLVFDDRCAYFGFRAYDPEPEQIQARLSDRDSIGSDDQVGVNLDTFNDERRDYNFFINPLGVQEDCIRSSDEDYDLSWDAIWDSAARIHDWGYSAEIAVPFSSIRFQRKDGD
jgi:hypothetical protein